MELHQAGQSDTKPRCICQRLQLRNMNTKLRLVDSWTSLLTAYIAISRCFFGSSSDPNLLKGGVDLDIRIQTDKENGIITIMDSSIGMTRQELIDCLGTIAQSGIVKFLKALKVHQYLA
ncbi:hypothetical protein LOK49_LG12G03042 [Camellia lanceoleosa]|uniref:Uncharacterized protein n=1 Tax=Camellia lanceoleosa TaxID=1840588 RepID=A0ACC0FNU3_9ERIC|nr:hypothetical protein LOK49_LG12G03042 [Camellia lanceoleosa]